jgi:hypothetical protein
MRLDLVERLSFQLVYSVESTLDTYPSLNWSKYIVVWGALLYPLKASAELVENLAFTLFNALGSCFSEQCRYDAAVCLRKSCIGLLKTVVSPLSALALSVGCIAMFIGITKTQAAKKKELFTETHLISYIGHLHAQTIKALTDPWLPKPAVDEKRVTQAVLRECEKLGKYTVSKSQHITAREHQGSFFMDEWNRYWQVLVCRIDMKEFTNTDYILVREINSLYMPTFFDWGTHTFKIEKTDLISKILPTFVQST